jgi:hypothetical protein
LQLEGQNGDHSVPAEQLLVRAKALFGMRASTPLDVQQNRAFKKKETRAAMAATTEEEWQFLEWFYAVDPVRCEDAKFRRHDLAQLLNNWGGEVSKARMAAANNGFRPGGEKKMAAEVPANWRELLSADDRTFALPEHFCELPESVQGHARRLAAMEQS